VNAEMSQADKRRRRSRTQAKRQRTRELTAELNRIAAGPAFSDADAQALDDVVEELRMIAQSFNGAVSVWLRARDTRSYLAGTPSQPGRDRSGVPMAGRIKAPRGLQNAQREVSGGLPGTQRRH